MTQTKRVRKLLQALGSPATGARTGWVVARCPLAKWTHQDGKDKNPSFGVSTDGRRAHCFSCGFSGSPWDLIFEMRFRGAKGLSEARKLLEEIDEALPDIATLEELERPKKNLVEFPEQWLSTFPPARNFERAMAYLESRGVRAIVCTELDLRFDPLAGRVCFPVRDFDGVLRGLHGRYINPPSGGPKYHAYTYEGKYNRDVWLGEHWSNAERPIVLVESVFDLAAVFPINPNVMASLHAGVTKQRAARLGDFLEIVTLYDADKAGDNARKVISNTLTDSIVWHAKPTEEENDPGEMTPARIEEELGRYLYLDDGTMRAVDAVM